MPLVQVFRKFLWSTERAEDRKEHCHVGLDEMNQIKRRALMLAYFRFQHLVYTRCRHASLRATALIGVCFSHRWERKTGQERSTSLSGERRRSACACAHLLRRSSDRLR
jgi:hypothetical protein